MSYEMYRQQFEGESFNDVMVEQLRRAPWLLLSAAFHGVIILLLMLFVKDDPPVEEPEDIQALLDNDEIEEDPEEEIEEPEEEPEEVEQVEDPVIEDVEVDDHDEDDNNEEYEETQGEEDNLSDKPFDGTGTNDAIGLGGGAGGSFGGRRGGRRRARQGRGGRAQKAVDLGLEWLARHQSADGSWDTDGFCCNKETGVCGCLENSKGGPLYDVGNSGLALLAFLGAGETHRNGQYKKTVRKGLKWMMGQQDPEGCLGTRSVKQFTYNHAIAAFALTEAYGITKSTLIREAAQKSIDFCIKAQNPYKAWRYNVQPGDNDSSVTGWMVMALKSAKDAGLSVDPQSLEWAVDFTDQMTDPESGRTGYTKKGEPPVRAQGRQDQFPSAETESLTAVGVCARIFGGANPDEDRMIKLGVQLMEKKLPSWDTAKGSIDMYYWYYGSLAMFQAGGSPWNNWNTAMNKAIVERQHKEGERKGSWDPIGAWGEDGGRVYSTALLTLCLEVYYRYGKTLGAR